MLFGSDDDDDGDGELNIRNEFNGPDGEEVSDLLIVLSVIYEDNRSECMWSMMLVD